MLSSVEHESFFISPGHEDRSAVVLDYLKKHHLDILSISPNRPGPGCSKLTTSLVNVSLNFQKF